LAKLENLSALTSDYQLNEIAIKVEEKLHQNGARQKASAMEILVKYNEEIGTKKYNTYPNSAFIISRRSKGK